ncbi:hypothetical protein [Nostoc sp. FACHB-190]|uniref:hypothetical protein n=1 Tax=Nostoc sp. FACHB-190 TaxID=2692838 RepID=UPI00168621A6|nr:hypothetical protein [Nostoc sp. FACHB-190]MBD2303213.1 hypothetical protein [Nostoc sp. FACHB-190]
MLFQISTNAEILDSIATSLSQILGCSSSGMIHTAIMQRQNTMSSLNLKVTKKQANLIQNFMSTLPSTHLLKLAKSRISKKILEQHRDNHPIFCKWIEMRGFNQWLGKSLKARLLAESEDPTWEAWNKGQIRQIDYESIILLVDYYQAILNLLQTGWPYLKEVLLKYNLYTKIQNPTNYFLGIVMQDTNEEFQDYILGYQDTLKQKEYRAKTLRNFLWLEPSKGSYINEAKLLSLPNISNGTMHNEISGRQVYFKLAINVCSQAAKSNTRLLAKLEGLKKILIEMSDLQVKQCQAERGTKPPRLVESIKWVDGMPYKGVKGGWKPML